MSRSLIATLSHIFIFHKSDQPINRSMVHQQILHAHKKYNNLLSGKTAHKRRCTCIWNEVQVQRGTNAQVDTMYYIYIHVYIFILYTYMYIANQWNSTISMGYVVKRKHLKRILGFTPTPMCHLRSNTTTTPNRYGRIHFEFVPAPARRQAVSGPSTSIVSAGVASTGC